MYIIRSEETEDPRRRVLIRALAAGLFSAGAAPAALAQVFGRMPSKIPPGQSIFRISGSHSRPLKGTAPRHTRSS